MSSFSQLQTIDSQDTIFVIGAAIFTSLLTEGKHEYIWYIYIGISWLLIYRHADYKSLINNIQSLNKKVEKLKD